MQSVEADQVQLEHTAPQAAGPQQEPLHYAPVNASSDHDRRFQKKVPPTTVAPTYKLTLPSEFVLTHMPDMMHGDFTMVSADGTQSFSVSIVPRRNKDKFEYTVQAKAWKQVVEGLGIKEGDLLEFELTLERNLRVTVMKSSTVTRKPKKMAPSELQATINKKKNYRNVPMDQLSRSMMLTGQEGILPDLLLPAAAAAAAAAQGLPIRLPDVSAAQEALAAASASQYTTNAEEDVYPPGAHAITHGAMPQAQEGMEGVEGEQNQMAKRTAEWVQEGEEEQEEAKRARLEADAGTSPQNRGGTHGKKAVRASTGAMNLLANAAEDNEAYEHQLTQAQLQQLHQHLIQQQVQQQPRSTTHEMDPRLLLSKQTIEAETNAGLKALTHLLSLPLRLKETRVYQSLEGESMEELNAIHRELEQNAEIVLDSLYRIKKVPKAWM